MFTATQETQEKLSLFKPVPLRAYKHLGLVERIAAHRNVVSDRVQVAILSTLLACEGSGLAFKEEVLRAPAIALAVGATALAVSHVTQAYYHAQEAQELLATTQPALNNQA